MLTTFPGKFDVEDIPPSLCSHLVFGFAGVDPINHTLRVLDPYNDLTENWGLGAYKRCFPYITVITFIIFITHISRFTDLKKSQPTLKTLLAVGGWNEGATVFSDMVGLSGL